MQHLCSYTHMIPGSRSTQRRNESIIYYINYYNILYSFPSKIPGIKLCFNELFRQFYSMQVWQTEVECGCMVLLRYWQLFYGKQYNLKGEKARAQVLKYYMIIETITRRWKALKTVMKTKTKQLRSRTALTRKGPSSRLLGSSFMKRI